MTHPGGGSGTGPGGGGGTGPGREIPRRRTYLSAIPAAVLRIALVGPARRRLLSLI